MDPYLVSGLPMIDVLVLDEADRMIADGHFKEMREILAYIYSERVKRKWRGKKGNKDGDGEADEGQVDLEKYEEAALDRQNFFVGKNLEGGDDPIDIGGVQDIYDDDNLMDGFKDEGAFEMGVKKEEKDGQKKKKLPTKS